MKKENLFWWLIVLLALVLRIWRLDLNPIGLVHDEIHQLVNAKSIALTGTGASGTGAGIFQNEPYCDGNCVFGELPTFLLIPFAFFKTVFPWLKIPLILASILMMVGFMKFFENITKNKTIALLVGLMIAINPWAINFGRTAYENVFSFMFYIWAGYFLTKNNFNIKNQIIGVILGFAASMCYFGAKPIFVPLMLAFLSYGWWKEKRKKIKKYLLLSIFTVVLMAGYGLILKNSFAGLRMNETKLMSNEIINEVNEERRMSLNIPVLRDIFINKYTVLGKSLLKKYFAGLAPNYLFNEGEMGYDHFMIAGHPFMYLIDVPMILVGIWGLSLISLPALILVLLTIFIIPITPMISNYATTYALRSGLLYPLLASISGIGIYFLIKQLKGKWKVVIEILLTLIYLISLINFEVMYWYRNPFEKSAGWVFYERQAVKYVELIKEEKSKINIEIVTSDPVDMVYEYAIFSGRINNKGFIKEMNETIKSREYSIDGIKFSKICPKEIDENTIYLFGSNLACVEEPNNLARISEVRDAGTRWAIPNEILCEEVKLSQYPYPRKIEEFKIENMSKEEFCKTWVSQPL